MLSRRRALAAGLAVPALTLPDSSAAKFHAPFVPSQQIWSPPAVQAPVTEGLAPLRSTRLRYWDTGGSGQAIVLLHPYSGSHESWAYQQPVFAAAGYRVVSYSRRGHYQSDPVDPQAAGSDAEDLSDLLDHLRIDRPHIVAVAGGGLVFREFQNRWPQRSRSLVIASSMVVIPSLTGTNIRSFFPPAWFDLPISLRELGPSYRFGYPDGVKMWEAIAARSSRGVNLNRTGLSAIDPTLLPPVLAVTGDADAYLPPSMLRSFAKAAPAAQIAVVAEAGHAVFWEQPDAFNALVLDFLKRH